MRGCPARRAKGADGWGGLTGAGTVRVEVADVSCRPPSPRHVRGDETGGRGLELVEGLADRWGWTREDDGKGIWCEVDRVVKDSPCCGASGCRGVVCMRIARARVTGVRGVEWAAC